MRRAGCVLGTFLILFAFMAMAALVVIPVLPFGENNPTLMQIKGALLCEPGQQYVMEGHNFSDNRGSGRTFQVYCVKDGETKIDVSAKDFGVSILLFIIPFLIGLFMVIGAGTASARSRARGVLQDFQTVQTPDGEVINVGGMQIRLKTGEPLSASPQVFGFGQQQPLDLAGKLKQVEQARSQGLITQAEYDLMRKRILDDNM